MRSGDDRRARVLRSGTRQVLWALGLVYLIVLGLAFPIAREAGGDIAWYACGGVAFLVTVAFVLVHSLDRISAAVLAYRERRKGSPERKGRVRPGATSGDSPDAERTPSWSRRKRFMRHGKEGSA